MGALPNESPQHLTSLLDTKKRLLCKEFLKINLFAKFILKGFISLNFPIKFDISNLTLKKGEI